MLSCFACVRVSSLTLFPDCLQLLYPDSVQSSLETLHVSFELKTNLARCLDMSLRPCLGVRKLRWGKVCEEEGWSDARVRTLPSSLWGLQPRSALVTGLVVTSHVSSCAVAHTCQISTVTSANRMISAYISGPQAHPPCTRRAIKTPMRIRRMACSSARLVGISESNI